MTDQIIKLDNVSFSYEKNIVLNQLSLDVPENRIGFLMGNNGSGKTTTLKCILGMLVPQKGEIRIKDKPVSAYDKRSLSRIISYVPQAINLNTDFSVIDYLCLGRTPYIKQTGRLKKEDYQIIDKYAEKLDVESIYDVPFNKLSGGQKQIVAITRSLVQDTPIIIMDEPMSALDIGRQAEFLFLLQKLAKEGKTILLTTHNPNHALTIDSDAYFLENGNLVACGRSETIISRELLQMIYGDKITIDHGQKQDAIVFDKESIIS